MEERNCKANCGLKFNTFEELMEYVEREAEKRVNQILKTQIKGEAPHPGDGAAAEPSFPERVLLSFFWLIKGLEEDLALIRGYLMLYFKDFRLFKIRVVVVEIAKMRV